MQAEDEKEQVKQKARASLTARIALYSGIFVLFVSPIFTIIIKIHHSYGEEIIALLIIGIPFSLAITFASLTAIATALITLLSLPFIEAKAKNFIMALGALLLLLPAAFILPPLGAAGPRARRVVCATNLKVLGTAFNIYANEYNDQLPTNENWGDILITKMDVSTKTFVCPSTGVVEGESSYAMNENVAGMKLSEIPKKVVLLFETRLGQSEEGRNFPITSRKYIIEMPYMLKSSDESYNVHEACWNQVGGAEILTMENHQGRGCNILFADGHAEFVKTQDIHNLRWKP
jgi:prepilin-type processing-associated H-X9-DG protein